MCRCILLANFELFYEKLQSHTILAHIHMYTYIHTHTIVDIQEMHYLLLMIMHEDMVNDLTNYFKTPEVLHIQISKKLIY